MSLSHALLKASRQAGVRTDGNESKGEREGAIARREHTVEGRRLFFKRAEMKIFTCCQERSSGGKLGVKEVDGMINRASVS